MNMFRLASPTDGGGAQQTTSRSCSSGGAFSSSALGTGAGRVEVRLTAAWLTLLEFLLAVVGFELPPKPKKVHQRKRIATNPSASAKISFFRSPGFLMLAICIGRSIAPQGQSQPGCAESTSPCPNVNSRAMRAHRRLRRWPQRYFRSRVPTRSH
jgi:hypothetical protein